MNKWTKALLWFLIANVILTPIIIFFVTGNLVFNRSMQMVNNETTTKEMVIHHLQTSGYSVENFEKIYSVKEKTIPSNFQEHHIPIYWISTDGNINKPTVVLVHGLGGSHYSVYPYAERFLQLGYNVVTYDQRSTGANTAQYTTYGVWESKDLDDVVSAVRGTIDESLPIGVWGTSFGAATTGIYISTARGSAMVNWAILDSPISNMRDMLRMGMEEGDAPFPTWWNLLAGDVMTQLRLGISYDDADVTSQIIKTRVPVLVIHSNADTMTPPYMARALYDATGGEKKIYTFESGAHAGLLQAFPKVYVSVLERWVTAQR
ncbi:MAG: alpha/beta hydrolase [Bacilli bacterium]